MDGIASGRAHQYVSMQGVVYRASCSRHDELLLRESADACGCGRMPVCVCAFDVFWHGVRGHLCASSVVDGVYTMRAMQ